MQVLELLLSDHGEGEVVLCQPEEALGLRPELHNNLGGCIPNTSLQVVFRVAVCSMHYSHPVLTSPRHCSLDWAVNERDLHLQMRVK